MLRGHADARRARRVSAVLAALLPADQRHVGEVQRAAGGDGLVRADLQAARRAGRGQLASASRRDSSPVSRGRPATSRRWATSSFDHVWFAYKRRGLRPARRVLRGRRRASASAIVGATGSGKTTLINLLLRFYDVQRGRITVDGVDIRELDLAELRGAVQPRAAGRASVLGHDRRQHPARQRGDRRRRRAAGGRGRACRRVHRAAAGRATRAPVAERGATLSVGQKQLLSFARALAFDPRVLILDEATSSVDTETELLIRDALTVLMARPHDDRHRASAVDDPGHGQDPGAAQGRSCASRARTRSCSPQRGIYFRLFELQYKEQAPRDSQTAARPRRSAVEGHAMLSGAAPTHVDGLRLPEQRRDCRPCRQPSGRQTGRQLSGGNLRQSDGTRGSGRAAAARVAPRKRRVEQARRRRVRVPAEAQHRQP